MRKLLLTILPFFVFGCSNAVKREDVAQLKGYWEISHVQAPGQEKKEYGVNPVVDYFELKSGSGVRRKVMPQFDGTFMDASIPERVKVLDSAGHIYLSFRTRYTNWSEEVLEKTEKTLVLRNKQGIEYHYKKFEPFNIK